MATDFSADQYRKRRERKGYIRESTKARKLRQSVKSLNLEMAERFRAWLGAQKYATSTQERYHRVACKLCEFIGRKTLASVTPMDIGDFLTQTLPDRWQDSYISDHLGSLRSFFDFLYLGGVVDSVAPRFLKARARSKPLPRSLTEAQVRKLILMASHPRDRALIEMLYATGCRIGELRLARVEDIDFRGRKLRVRGKRKERMVYFGKQAAKTLRAYLGSRKIGYLFQDKIPQQKGYVTFTKTTWLGIWTDHRTGRKHGVKHTKRLGSRSVITRKEACCRLRTFLREQKIDLFRHRPDRPMNRSALGFIVRELGRQAGIPRVSPHSIRHSFATHLLERGADIRAIQELLGHAYLTSTQVYTRISNKAVKSAFKKFHPRG
jgi:site-specific recombinase XerD